MLSHRFASGSSIDEEDIDGILYGDLDVERVVANAAELVAVQDDPKSTIVAATYVADHGFTPFDAIHFVESDGETIVSSDEVYDGFAPRMELNGDGGPTE